MSQNLLALFDSGAGRNYIRRQFKSGEGVNIMYYHSERIIFVFVLLLKKLSVKSVKKSPRCCSEIFKTLGFENNYKIKYDEVI